MKRLIVAVLMALSVVVASAQVTMIKGGAQFSRFSSDKSESMLGIRAGIGGYVPLGQSSFYFMPQLLYAQKGQSSGRYLGDCTIHYAEIPVTIGALLKFTKNIGLGLMAGPYVAVGVAGKSDNPNVGNVFDAIGRTDAGITAGIQFHVWRLFVFADYDYGIRNLVRTKNSEMGEYLSTRSLSAGVGFAF